MTIDLAKDIILKEAKMIEKSDQFDEIQIDFMGGEPLMNFSLIKDVVEWLESGAINVPWVCFASTNATLINKDIRAWLKRT